MYNKYVLVGDHPQAKKKEDVQEEVQVGIQLLQDKK